MRKLEVRTPVKSSRTVGMITYACCTSCKRDRWLQGLVKNDTQIVTIIYRRFMR